MRSVFCQTVLEMARRDPRVMLLTADLGWGALDEFQQTLPRQFLNVGVAEQNLVGIATGLAMNGAVPFIYSIANFVTMRCYEQLRNGPVMHRLPLRIIGVGGGYSYGHAGPSHHCFEELGILRALPGMTVLAPVDGAQLRTALWDTASFPGPVYYRVDKNSQPDLAGLEGRFATHQPQIVRQGTGLLYLATGSIAGIVLKAAQQLDRRGYRPTVAVLPHLPHAPFQALTDLLAGYPAVITVEEAFIAGGLGALAAQAISQAGLATRLEMRGVTQLCMGITGGPEYLLARAGLTPECLAEAGLTLLRSNARRAAA